MTDRPHFSPEALAVFRRLQALHPIECTCGKLPTGAPYWTLVKQCSAHSEEDDLERKLYYLWPRAVMKPWFDPIVAYPDEQCPLPIGHRDRPQWFKDHAAAAERWKQIEAAADAAEAKTI